MATSTGFVYVSATHGNAPTLQPNKFAKSFAGVMTGEFSFGHHDWLVFNPKIQMNYRYQVWEIYMWGLFHFNHQTD